MTKRKSAAGLSLGPVQFNWKPETWRDFYFRIADEAPVDVVYVGEAVCSKRTPFFAPHIPEVIERLEGAGKRVVLSTLALIMSRREMEMVRDTAQISAEGGDILVEANDVAACALLAGRPHVVGPFVNVFNEGTVDYLARKGAARFCLPIELDRDAIAALAATAARHGAETEVQVFGRMPLALSARCYHARARNLTKDNCQYVCADDPDGMALETVDGEPFLAVNGIQTMSYACLNLSAELDDLIKRGVGMFRLWPHSFDMVAVADIYRDLLDGRIAPADADEALERIAGGMAGGLLFANGYVHGKEGVAFLEGDAE